MSSSAEAKPVSIEGYALIERIGSGGYGEVWRANAPGGLTKAVKIVFGHMDDVRATRELKALRRVKDVRHPMLLSLERIEVVQGQLNIVTELADGSMLDCFVACRERGLEGIPREKLLVYLLDAADALDYMGEKHSLQHLDVKPENLLLLGDRVKVADFGLVKELHEQTISMMGGLTPVYTSPEVFHGGPSRFSDQYSLAIVYQHMLTGRLPYPGKTAAQLAAQHLYGRPQLSPLPPADRPILERALAKVPTDRFANCRQMAEELLRADSQSPSSATPAQAHTTPGAVTSASEPSTVHLKSPANAPPTLHSATTQGKPDANQSGNAPIVAPANQAQSPQPRDWEDLPPLQLDAAAPVLRPTLFVGIGGAAGHVLAQLRVKLNQQYGDLGQLPAFEMLLLDTDQRQLGAHLRAEGPAGFSSDKALPLPLRRPQEYRASSRSLLPWLSRRWLYNVPRSLNTEGLRPLGRLALVDHIDTVHTALSRAIDSVMHPDALAQTAKVTGFAETDKAPRVVVVASISGATGGGMAIDVSYMIRQLLEERELSSQDVQGVLLYGTPRTAEAKQLAIANAYAFLTELYHFSRNGLMFPGDASCHLTPRDPDDRTFPTAYLMHMGDDMGDEALETAADRAATYLLLDTATSAQEFLAGCRQPSDTAIGGPVVGTFGLYRVGCQTGDVLDTAVDELCRRAIEIWGGSDTVDQAKIAATSEARAAELGLNVDALWENASVAIGAELGPFLSDALNVRHLPANELIAKLNEICGRRGQPKGEAVPVRLEIFLEAHVKQLIQDIANQLHEWALAHVNNPQAGVTGAQATIGWFREHVAGVRAVLEDRLQGTLEAAIALERTLNASVEPARKGRFGRGRPAETSDEPNGERLLELRIEEVALRYLVKLGQSVAVQISQLEDFLVDLKRELTHLSGEFAAWLDEGIEDKDGLVDSNQITLSVMDGLKKSLGTLSRELDIKLREVLCEVGGVGALARCEPELRRGLPHQMRALGRGVVLEHVRHSDAASVLLDSIDDDNPAAVAAGHWFDEARPLWRNCGGRRRELLMLPEGESGRQLHASLADFEKTTNVVYHDSGDVVACHDVQDMSLALLARKLVGQLPGGASVAERLHTRVDVQWSAMP